MDSASPRRAKVPRDVEAAVLVKSGRRCCVCFCYGMDFTQKMGQIAHLDQDPSNAAEDNLVFLCMAHHSEYDSTTSQHKNYTEEEVKTLRGKLHAAVEALLAVTAERLRWRFSISGSIRDLTKDDVVKLQENLRSLLDDPTLRVDHLADGSVVVEVESSFAGFLKALEIAKSDEFTQHIGELVSMPGAPHTAVLDLTNFLYTATMQTLSDPRAAAAVVQSVLVETGLLTPLAEISSSRLSSAWENSRYTFVERFEREGVERVARFSQELQLIVMMAALLRSPEYAAEMLGIELRHAETYLMLGSLVWQDSSENRVALA